MVGKVDMFTSRVFEVDDESVMMVAQVFRVVTKIEDKWFLICQGCC